MPTLPLSKKLNMAQVQHSVHVRLGKWEPNVGDSILNGCRNRFKSQVLFWWCCPKARWLPPVVKRSLMQA